MTLTYKPQPDSAAYGLDALEAITYTRATYLAAFGTQAPAFDPSRPIQRWADENAAGAPPAEMYVYSIIEAQPGAAKKRQMMIPNAQAAKINLPGAFVYPAPTVKPSGAWNAKTNELGQVVGKNVITANALTEKLDAVALITELRANGITVDTFPVEASLTGIYAVHYDEGETRRLWNVVIDGGQQNAGLLLETRNRAGVGAPGKWVKAAAGNGVIWQSAPVETAAFDTRPETPPPMRDLMFNEAFRVAGFSVGVKRVDKAETAAVDNSSNMAGNVAEILTIVRQLANR